MFDDRDTQRESDGDTRNVRLAITINKAPGQKSVHKLTYIIFFFLVIMQSNIWLKIEHPIAEFVPNVFGTNYRQMKIISSSSLCFIVLSGWKIQGFLVIIICSYFSVLKMIFNLNQITKLVLQVWRNHSKIKILSWFIFWI